MNKKLAEELCYQIFTEEIPLPMARALSKEAFESILNLNLL